LFNEGTAVLTPQLPPALALPIIAAFAVLAWLPIVALVLGIRALI
jgi:hypothetical protein